MNTGSVSKEALQIIISTLLEIIHLYGKVRPDCPVEIKDVFLISADNKTLVSLCLIKHATSANFLGNGQVQPDSLLLRIFILRDGVFRRASSWGLPTILFDVSSTESSVSFGQIISDKVLFTVIETLKTAINLSRQEFAQKRAFAHDTPFYLLFG